MSENPELQSGLPRFTRKGLIIIAIAAILAFGLYNILPYSNSANKGLALLLFIAILWFTEAVHITITAFMIPVLAILIGITTKDAKTGGDVAMSIKQAMSTFADPIIFLFFGGFALATALHIQKLDKKIAMWLISLSGSHLGIATIAICGVTAALSMWISNTATAAMMLPLALGMLTHLDQEKDRSTFVFILLGIAYSASIGGLGTLVGSPPNAIAAAALEMDFTEWMKVGLPMMLVLLPLMLLTLYIVLRPNLNRKIQLETEEIPWNLTRVMTMILFLCTALAWIFGKNISAIVGFNVSDSWVALSAAILVVTLGLATWGDVAKGTDWGVLMLFGGGLTLSALLRDSGASLALGQEVARVFGNAPHIVIIAVVAVFIIILTEFTSNTASAALLVPVFATIAAQIGLPKEVLVLVIGIGASCAFMLPVATPPNAVVFGTGLIRQREMMKAGAFLSLGCVVILTLYTYFFLM
ncbi:MAG: DASS family sodium-coupled anion symporter [Neisseria sp.]|nr:DASS family sodium-coupled anion symporter [Neisseria sp.]